MCLSRSDNWRLHGFSHDMAVDVLVDLNLPGRHDRGVIHGLP
jgi:hypothetical protein